MPALHLTFNFAHRLMQYHLLGTSDLTVSELCLGTMTYGQQNTIAEAHQQLDYAIDQGVNFIDTAEMYPVPARAETYGSTEAVVGEWLTHQQRDRLIIATKIAGPGRSMKWIRNGERAVDRRNLTQAVDGSLKRLRTDYIDLYQIHWPDRAVPLFGQTEYIPRSMQDSMRTPVQEPVPIEEQLSVFADLVNAGKIRYVGLSNETPWGVCEFARVAEQLGLPKVVSIQNAYNLINRTFEVALAEVCYEETIGLLTYSPLGFGLLSGKYLNQQPDRTPITSRMTLFPNFGQRYLKPNVTEAVTAYIDIAHRYGISPVQFALAFVRSRWFVTSTIVGATTIDQLKENLNSVAVPLDSAIVAEINAVHTRYPSPAP